MRTFKNFLYEVYSPTQIEDNQFMQLCEKSAANYLNATSNSIIYRGFGGLDENNTPDTGVIDSRLFNRRSAHTRNYYTIWIDNNPSWDGYPKRSQGLICSSALVTAKQYGGIHNVNIIIPFDDVNIAKCPARDLWFSFENGLGQVVPRSGRPPFNMEDFNDLLHRLILIKFGESDAQHAQRSYTNLTYMLKEITIDELNKIVDDYTMTSMQIKDINNIIHFMKNNSINDLFELFNICLDPEQNGFSILETNNVYADKSNEIWIQGKCATINYIYLQEIKHDKDHVLHEFCLKYNLFRALV